MMTSIYEVMALCHERMDANHEAKYHEMRAALKKFINENAQSKAHKIAPDHDDRARLIIGTKGRSQFCQSTDYANRKRLLLEILAAERMAELRKRLETPGDPGEGACP